MLVRQIFTFLALIWFVRGIFVSSSVEGIDGFTDYGFYIDGDLADDSFDAVQDLVENDRAYEVEVQRDLIGRTYVVLESSNRKKVAEIGEEVGSRNRGMESTFYHRTGDPIVPHQLEDRRKQSELLTTLAEYALEHYEEDGFKVEDVDLESLMDDEHLSPI